MRIYWCRTERWLALPDVVRYFCAQMDIKAGDFLCHEDLVPHAAGRYLLLRGFREYCPERTMPPLVETQEGKLYFSEKQPFFSISHSGNIAICAFAQTELGADIEKVEDVDKSLLSVLRPEERKYLRRFPKQRQTREFYRLWTQKESLLKANAGVLADIFQQESVITPEGRWKECADGFQLRKILFPDRAYVLSVSAAEEEPAELIRLELPESIAEL